MQVINTWLKTLRTRKFFTDMLPLTPSSFPDAIILETFRSDNQPIDFNGKKIMNEFSSTDLQSCQR